MLKWKIQVNLIYCICCMLNSLVFSYNSFSKQIMEKGQLMTNICLMASLFISCERTLLKDANQ